MVAHRVRNGTVLRLIGSVVGMLPFAVYAQFGPLPSPPKEPPAWAADLPGYWTSLITENWRLRMVTPARGDYIGIPLTAAAQKIADAWDPGKDQAQGLQCRSYGAGMIMLRPENLHITWQDKSALQIQIDAGMQTRLLHFGSGPVESSDNLPHSWQGYSLAEWKSRRSDGYPFPGNARYLAVTTTHILPGYLRQNGVPYSTNAVLSEDYDVVRVSSAEEYLIVTTTMTDPFYLDYPLTLSAIFEKQPDGATWDPTPCSASW